ncbi:MAG: DUF2062 domain-containing protein [Kiritimatiellae bacterium]|nr:DUF2062 domain-containing protein [Kiritimatiellia bacterium]MBQ6141527.1 DUF2062 domain-containing protein [Kiritimatiellia bacterium]
MKSGRKGWWRKTKAFFRLLRSKMVREEMPPNRIAAGWAIGMFAGCSIPFGFQLVVSIPLAIITKTSKVGATVATFVTNPVTIFFIYPAQTWAVHRVLFGSSPNLPSEWTWETVRALAGRTIASFFIGGLVLAALLTPPTYFLVKRTVVAHRERRRLRAEAAAAAEGARP